MDDAALARWLDPEVRAFIAETERLCPPTAAPGDREEARALYDRLCAGFRAPRPAGVAVADGMAGGVAVRRYRPPGAARAAGLLYLHGGGFMLGGLDSHDDICAELCAGAGVEVMAVAYRLAPEHRYPAALDDVSAAYRAFAVERPVVVAGDSAGGNLAAALCLRRRRLGEAQPRGQVLIYPGLAPDPLRVAGRRIATAPMLSAEECATFARLYGGRPVPADDPEFAPLAARDLAGLAPAALFAAGFDPLRDDAEDYAAALHAAGVTVRFRADPGLVHGWLRGRHRMALARDAFAALVTAISQFAGETSP